ncbi:CHAT domain-containing protein [Bradyrhizobium australiense]|uniref:CHAT domain-containing protein n=1 Tax=Bradyrhizobium australiense TaxID=2721161 RepID=UPI0035DFE1C2
MPQLPDTADEFNTIAKNLGVAAADIHLGEEASETRAQAHAARRVWHCLFRDPAHRQRSRAVEAQRRLGGAISLQYDRRQKTGAEALSGLARSYFYAGARALLVSHWAVNSEAATRLSISTFDHMKADYRIGRAEALCQAMLAYLNDTSWPRNAYPGALCADRRGRRALKPFDCAAQQFWAKLASGGWSRNQLGKPAKSSAASD